MKMRRVLAVLVVAQVVLGGCGDPDPHRTSPSSEDVEASDDGTDVLDDGTDVLDDGLAMAEIDETATELDAGIDTGLVEPEYHSVGSIVAAQGIHTDEDGEYRLYGTLGCLSGGSVVARNDDYTLTSFVGEF